MLGGGSISCRGGLGPYNRAMRTLAVLFALLVLAPASIARADSRVLGDLFGPREIAVGESMRADARGHLATTLNPAGLSLSKQLVFHGSYGFRGEDSASAVAVSACDSTVPFPGCFYYNYFAAEPAVAGANMSRRLHQFGVTMSRAITQRLLIGVNSKYFDYNSNLDGEEDSSGFAVDAGLILRATEGANLAFVGYNLVAKDSAQYPRALAAGASVRPFGSLSLSFDALWEVGGDDEMKSGGRYGGGGEFFLSSDSQSGFPIRGGVVYDDALDATYATGGLGFVSTRLGIDIGLRKQVEGGDELMVHAGLRLFGGH